VLISIHHFGIIKQALCGEKKGYLAGFVPNIWAIKNPRYNLGFIYQSNIA
jgi:hypothetical protein